MDKNRYVIAADIGGSHITAAVVDLTDKSIIADSYCRIAIDAQGNAQDIISNWAGNLKISCQKAGLQPYRLSIAMPGPFDYDKGISYMLENSKYKALYGLNVKDLLGEQLGISRTDILMKNDAACFLAGEMFSGAVIDYPVVVGITLGTGLGAAIARNGEAVDADLWCSPFRDGIAEDYLSASWFLKWYYQLSGVNMLSVKQMCAIYNENQTVRHVFNEFSNNLSLFLAHCQNDINADAIVIGGNIANASGIFLASLVRKLINLDVTIPVLISSLGEKAALIGAASCWGYNSSPKIMDVGR